MAPALRSRPHARIAATTAVAAVALGAVVEAPASAARRAPVVHQMVVFRSGKAVAKRVSARRALARVGRRRCAVGTGTALAALVRSRVGRLSLRDYGSCSRRRARDGYGLFVRAIRRDRNRGRNGWVYKVGRRAATAGAADLSGPFGTGRRLRSRQRVLWFYCRLGGRGCQRTLALRLRAEPGAVVATALGYDDEGRGVRVAGATVRVGPATGTTGYDGVVRLSVPPGRHRASAKKRRLVRSFPERVTVGG